MAHAPALQFFEMALAFFKQWPDQSRAAQLVLGAPPRSTETRIICSIRRHG